MSEKQKKQVVATNLESLTPDILDQQPTAPVESEPAADAKPVEAKAAEQPVKVTVKKLEVREKAEPRTAQSAEAAKPVEVPKTSLTMAAVERELDSIKQRLGVVETGQASAEARLKAIEANGVEIASTLAVLRDMQATAEKRLAQAENDAMAAKAAATVAVEDVAHVCKQQRKIAEAIIVTQQRQTPWGMFQAWRAARKLHAERERETMEELHKKEYEQSIQAVADGTFKPAEA